MSEKQAESDEPRYQVWNRLTAVSSSLSLLLVTTSQAFPAVEGHTAEGGSVEVAEASQVDPLPREMSQLSLILEVEQESQNTSSTEIHLPLLLPQDTISPYSRAIVCRQMRQSQHIETNTQLQQNSQTTFRSSETRETSPTNNKLLYSTNHNLTLKFDPVAVVESEIRVVDFLQVAPLDVVKRLTDVFGIKGR